MDLTSCSPVHLAWSECAWSLVLAVLELNGWTNTLLNNALFFGRLWVPSAIVFCSRILGRPSKEGVVFPFYTCHIFAMTSTAELVGSSVSSSFLCFTLCGLLPSALKFNCPDSPGQCRDIILETLPICKKAGILPNTVFRFAQSHED